MDLPLLRPHAPRGAPVKRSRKSRWRALALIGVHVAVLVHLAHWKVSGTTLTPVEPSEAMQTLELGYVNAGFLLFVVLILATLVLGRFFCGWACHVVAYQDLCAWLLKKVGLRPRPFRSRLLVFVPLGAAFYMFLWPTLLRLWQGRPAPTLSMHLETDAFWQTFPGPGIALLTLLVDGFLIVWFLGAKGFCTYGCPYGAIFGAVDRFATGRIRVTDSCEGCGHCTATCTSNVRVHEEVARFGMVVDPGCMKCMDCVSVCPKEALYFGFGKPALSKAGVVRNRSVKTYDLSWWGEVGVAVVFLVALYAFRNLYNAIPFLLALGLAAITAFVSHALLRLLLSAEFRLQSLWLRRGGRFTLAGRGALVLLPLFLALVAHSAYVQYHTKAGRAALLAGRVLPRPDCEPLITTALGHLHAAERAGLWPTGVLEHLIANAHRCIDQRPEAERRLQRALVLEPAFLAARMDLATLLKIRGDDQGAKEQLEFIRASRPTDAVEVDLVRLAGSRLGMIGDGQAPK